MTVAEQIKVLYVRSGVSEAELARRLGKSPQSFNSKMRRGTFSVDDLEKIATAMGVAFERHFILDNGERI
jgi:transcriptional regulator with XRE-family HTH domain